MSDTGPGRGMGCDETPKLRPVNNKVPAYHACRTITGADENKWNEMDEISVDKWCNEVCCTRKREKPREKPTQTMSRWTRNSHWVTEKRTRDPSGRRLASRGRLVVDITNHKVKHSRENSLVNLRRNNYCYSDKVKFRYFSLDIGYCHEVKWMMVRVYIINGVINH